VAKSADVLCMAPFFLFVSHISVSLFVFGRFFIIVSSSLFGLFSGGGVGVGLCGGGEKG
jgi:hypothetical protein